MSRILLIDDHPSMGVIVKAYLTALGGDPDTLDIREDVDQAVNAMAENDYSVILLDHMVPPEYHFRESMKLLSDVVGDTPVILFTGLPPVDFGKQPSDARISNILEKDDLSPETLKHAFQDAGMSI